jgi:hypothetical protein
MSFIENLDVNDLKFSMRTKLQTLIFLRVTEKYGKISNFFQKNVLHRNKRNLILYIFQFQF